MEGHVPDHVPVDSGKLRSSDTPYRFSFAGFASFTGFSNARSALLGSLKAPKKVPNCHAENHRCHAESPKISYAVRN